MFKKYGQFVNEPGMLWNLDIFGKSDFLIFVGPCGLFVLMENHFLNFRDLQESPNPIKIPILAPASD